MSTRFIALLYWNWKLVQRRTWFWLLLSLVVWTTQVEYSYWRLVESGSRRVIHDQVPMGILVLAAMLGRRLWLDDLKQGQREYLTALPLSTLLLFSSKLVAGALILLSAIAIHFAYDQSGLLFWASGIGGVQWRPTLSAAALPMAATITFSIYLFTSLFALGFRDRFNAIEAGGPGFLFGLVIGILLISSDLFLDPSWTWEAITGFHYLIVLALYFLFRKQIPASTSEFSRFTSIREVFVGPADDPPPASKRPVAKGQQTSAVDPGSLLAGCVVLVPTGLVIVSQALPAWDLTAYPSIDVNPWVFTAFTFGVVTLPFALLIGLTGLKGLQSLPRAVWVLFLSTPFGWPFYWFLAPGRGETRGVGAAWLLSPIALTLGYVCFVQDHWNRRPNGAIGVPVTATVDSTFPGLQVWEDGMLSAESGVSKTWIARLNNYGRMPSPWPNSDDNARRLRFDSIRPLSFLQKYRVPYDPDRVQPHEQAFRRALWGQFGEVRFSTEEGDPATIEYTELANEEFPNWWPSAATVGMRMTVSFPTIEERVVELLSRIEARGWTSEEVEDWSRKSRAYYYCYRYRVDQRYTKPRELTEKQSDFFDLALKKHYFSLDDEAASVRWILSELAEAPYPESSFSLGRLGRDLEPQYHLIRALQFLEGDGVSTLIRDAKSVRSITRKHSLLALATLNHPIVRGFFATEFERLSNYDSIQTSNSHVSFFDPVPDATFERLVAVLGLSNYGEAAIAPVIEFVRARPDSDVVELLGFSGSPTVLELLRHLESLGFERIIDARRRRTKGNFASSNSARSWKEAVALCRNRIELGLRPVDLLPQFLRGFPSNER